MTEVKPNAPSSEVMFNRELEFLERKHEAERRNLENRHEGEVKRLRERFGKQMISEKAKKKLN